MLSALEGAAGAFIVLAVLVDVFLSVIVPRAVGRRYRLSAHIVPPLWRVWRALAINVRDEDRRENVLATFAPLVLVALLAMWVAGLVIGYGIILYAVREQLRPVPDLGASLYFAGSSLLTIGYGDIVPIASFPRIVSLAAAASGLGVLAVTTAFLFQLFSAFQQREVFVVSLSTQAGQPPSGVTLLENHARLGIVDDLGNVFTEGQRWSAQVMESHMAYPMLSYFRSSHDHESWVATLGALLDAATLMVSAVDGGPIGKAKLMNGMGRHATHDLGQYFSLPTGSSVGVERHEFEVARARLAEAGYRLTSADEAWERFASLRATYATPLDAMARWWRIPPAEWVGDRSLLPVRHLAPAALISSPAPPQPVSRASER
ncbi:MAG: two pore domain potassium channel family protein [Candidatus Eremiobacteraeota bacterium]|nr:two pore domain potassium channel family protein [Candidatus Eremiobacteraeota bacterium]